MNSKDVLKNTIGMSRNVVDAYIGDLSDADLLVRPLPGMNHMAWQIGHLIGAERYFVEMIAPGSCPPLPEDFDAGHGRQQFNEDDPAKFYPLAKYKELWAAQRAATDAVVERMTDAELDRTDEKFPPFANSVGALLNLCGTHPLMHAGQFVAVRRKLGKPIAI
jgi:hypothetical protein